MARNINGGTDHAWWTIPGAPVHVGTIAFFLRTTQTTANTIPLSYWSSTSRNGFGFVLNAVANKINFQGWSASSNRVTITSTTSVNDGNAHHIACSYGRGSGNTCQLFVDGVQEASAAASGDWTSANTGFFIQAGDQADAFWPSYVGDIYEIAHWAANPVLSVDEIGALAKGFSPRLIRPDQLLFYAPLVSDTHEIRAASVLNSISGTTVSSHGRMVGGAV